LTLNNIIGYAKLSLAAAIVTLSMVPAVSQEAGVDKVSSPSIDPVLTELRNCKTDKERLATSIIDKSKAHNEAIDSCIAKNVQKGRQIADQLARLKALGSTKGDVDALNEKIAVLESQLETTAAQADSLTLALEESNADLAQAQARIAELGESLVPTFSYFKGSPYDSAVTRLDLEKRFDDVPVLTFDKCEDALAWLQEQKGNMRPVNLSVWISTSNQLGVCREGSSTPEVPSVSTEAHLLIFK